MRDLEELSKFISRLREMGCRVAIDDFGAGYTSFKNFRYLDVDMVKSTARSFSACRRVTSQFSSSCAR
ncbi:MAG: EAL domain-containing protein [Alphaproteobacteria bacterium]